MATWGYEISLLVFKKYFTRSLRSLVKYFSTLEEKFRISARPCNILYFVQPKLLKFWLKVKWNDPSWFNQARILVACIEAAAHASSRPFV